MMKNSEKKIIVSFDGKKDQFNIEDKKKTCSKSENSNVYACASGGGGGGGSV